jgi:integrase
MVLLGLNGGFGNEDLAGMPLSVLRLPEAMISYSRPKSGVRRRVPLWPETVDALNKWLAVRPDGSTSVNDSLVFLTETGTPMIQWHLDDEKHSKTDMIVMKFNRLSRRVGIWRKGFGFYVLRHTFRTNGRKLHDQMAVDFIMGHLSTDGAKMAETYIERTDDDVLLRVTDHVRSIVLKDYLASSANELVTFGNDYRVPPLDLT